MDVSRFGRKEAAVLVLVMVFVKGVGVTPPPPDEEFTYKDGALAKIPLGSSDGRHLHIWNVESQRFEIICDGRKCVEPPVYWIDGEDNLNFNVTEKTSGDYALIDFNTKETVHFRVNIQHGLSETEKWAISLIIAVVAMRRPAAWRG